jgi:tetratricopeptide (TPR) repeat protein
VLGGCRKQELLAPSEGGATWHTVETEHIRMFTDLTPRDAMRAAREFEVRYRLLADLLTARNAPEFHMQVIVFRRKQSLAQLAGSSSLGGMFTDQFPGVAGPVPALVVTGEPTRDSYGTWQHEVTHHLLHHALGDMPPWLNEGMAEYYEALRVEDGKVILGGQSRDFGFITGLEPGVEVDAGFKRVLIPIAHTPPVSKLIRLSRSEFYDPAIEHGLPREQIFRAGAWALVHMLMNGPPAYRERFGRVMRRVATGQHSFVEAFDDEFSTIAPKRFDDDFYRYLNTQWMLWRTDDVPRPGFAVSVRPLSEGRVLLLWGKVATFNPNNHAAAAPYFRRALAIAPGDPEVLAFGGQLACRRGNFVACEQALVEAADKDPNEGDYLVALLELYGSPAGPWPPTERAKKQRDVAERLEDRASSPVQLDAIAQYLLATQRVDEALTYSKLAFTRGPDCGQCFATHAAALFKNGNPSAAAAALRTAIRRMPEHAPASYLDRLRTRLRQYEAAAFQAGEANAATSPAPPHSPAVERDGSEI